MLAAGNAPAHAGPIHQFADADRQEVKNVFLRQAAAATPHDIVAFGRVLVSTAPDQPDPIAFVARTYQFLGKTAFIDHFKETFKGVWKFKPEVESIRIIPLTLDVAQAYARTLITLGHSDASAKIAPYLVYEVAVRTSEGWRIASIVLEPAQ